MHSLFNTKLAVISIARSTFDTEYAKEKAAAMAKQLITAGLDIVGDASNVFFEAQDALHAAEKLKQQNPHALLIIQASFTDAEATLKMAQAFEGMPIIMWNFQEERTGARLRLNSFCGVNLAAHALSRYGIKIHHIQGEADDNKAMEKLKDLSHAAAVVHKLKESKILVIGEHPTGFDPCNYDAEEVQKRFGVCIETMSNADFFERASAIDDEDIQELYAQKLAQMSNLSSLAQEPIIKTLKAAKAMQNLTQQKGYAGVAVRCWPEFFTQYGAAACGALGIMNELGIPAGCEADAYGVISSMLLQYTAADVVFNTDLVDIDTKDNSVVFWHCGQAPCQMKSEKIQAQATIHSNRKMPLLSEFPLKAGAMTFCRISRGFNEHKLVVGYGEMIDAPLAFSGTAGVAKLPLLAEEFMEQLIDIGLEHHVSIAYGQHINRLKNIANILNMPLLKMG